MTIKEETLNKNGKGLCKDCDIRMFKPEDYCKEHKTCQKIKS